MIKRFDKVDGSYVEKIYGQDRYGYSKSDTIDFYDLVELAKEGISRGSVVLIYDFEKGKVYTPFEKQNNIVYGDPVYVEKFIYFLQCDYNNAYSAESAHPFRRNGAPFRFKLSSAQIVN